MRPLEKKSSLISARPRVKRTTRLRTSSPGMVVHVVAIDRLPPKAPGAAMTLHCLWLLGMQFRSSRGSQHETVGTDWASRNESIGTAKREELLNTQLRAKKAASALVNR